MFRVKRWFGMVGGLCGGALLGAAGWLALAPEVSPLLVIDGYEYPIPLSDATSARRAIESAVALRSSQLLDDEVAIRADEYVIRTDAASLGYRVMDKQALDDAIRGLSEAHVSFGESPGIWLWRRFSDQPEMHAMSLALDLDRDVARRHLESLARSVSLEARDAQLLISEHKILASREGRELSVEGTLVRLEAGTFEEAVLVEGAIERIPPRVTEGDLAPVDVTRLLARYETSFRGKAGPRAINIRRAGAFLDGAIILPGEVLSFNEQVGRRIHGRGFVDAPVIVNDELEQDVGGGVCQVATTLHAAAVFGNVEIVRRRSHSRPSGYAPLGLDATVIDGKVDLQLRNPYDEPLLVHVSFPERYVIRVELLGRDPDVKVEHAYTVTHREPFARRVWYRDEAPLGGFEQKQKGSEGMDVVSVLRIKHEDGKIDRRTYHSKYYPVPEVYYVSEGTSHAVLPQMPENAVALVIDGQEVPGEGKPEAAASDEVPRMEDADGSSREPPVARPAPRDTN